MAILKSSLLKAVVLITLIFFLIFFAIRYWQTNLRSQYVVKTQVSPTQPPAQTSQVSSPDGAMAIGLTRENKKDRSKVYSLTVLDQASKSKRLIFTTRTFQNAEITIPHNSWSPDNKYVFLEESKSGSLNLLVLKTSGEPFENDQYLDVASLLAQKTDHILDGATGWVSPTLIQIYTRSGGSTKGPSFWFDVESKAFLRH